VITGTRLRFKPRAFGKTFDRKGSVGIKTAVTCLADFLHGMNELFRVAELTITP